MQIIMALLFSFALLVLAETASAQSATYSASVSFHSNLEVDTPNGKRVIPPLSDSEIIKILADASRTLQKPGHKDTDDNDVACDVTFTLKGPVRTFDDPPGTRAEDTLAIVTESNIVAVHRAGNADGADIHIKVVKEIYFCRKETAHVKGFAGCSFSPPDHRSIIVIHPALHRGPKRSKGPDHILWAHEFGHMTGLGHREDDELALMTPCDLAGQFFNVPDARVRINRNECRRLLAGPGFASPVPSKPNLSKCKCPGPTCGL